MYMHWMASKMILYSWLFTLLYTAYKSITKYIGFSKFSSTVASSVIYQLKIVQDSYICEHVQKQK